MQNQDFSGLDTELLEGFFSYRPVFRQEENKIIIKPRFSFQLLVGAIAFSVMGLIFTLVGIGMFTMNFVFGIVFLLAGLGGLYIGITLSMGLYRQYKYPIVFDKGKDTLFGLKVSGPFTFPLSEITALQLLCRIKDGRRYCQLNAVDSSSRRYGIIGIDTRTGWRGEVIDAAPEDLLDIAKAIADFLGGVPLVKQVEHAYLDDYKTREI